MLVFLILFSLESWGYLTPNVNLTTPVTAYTATFSSLTNATAVTNWHREGQYIVIEGKVKWTGAGGAGAFTVTLPGAAAGSPVIDTAALTGGTGVANATTTFLGTGYWFDSGNGWLFIYPVYATTTTVGFVMNTQILDGVQMANGDALNFTIRVPIVGWR